MGTSAGDRLELMELCARYSFYVDTFQLHPLVELFTHEGVFDESAVGMGRYEGHDMIRAYFRDDLFPVVDAWLHLPSNFMSIVSMDPAPVEGARRPWTPTYKVVHGCMELFGTKTITSARMADGAFARE
jgi:hypothetical protein